MDVDIRAATVADAAAGAACHLACWREAYTPIVGAASIDDAVGDLETAVARWQRVLADPVGPPRWLAVVADEVIGFGAGGPARDEDLADGVDELYAIYLRAAWHGTGVADRLVEAAIGDAPAVLWVLSDNARARAFYARHGFVPDGTEKVEERFGVPEARLRRPAP